MGIWTQWKFGSRIETNGEGKKAKMKKVNHNSYNNYDFFLTTAQPFLKYFSAQ
jgi:hypothetical protein